MIVGSMKCLPDKQEDLSLTQESKWGKRKNKPGVRACTWNPMLGVEIGFLRLSGQSD